jgi:hypothetical protein
MNFAAGKNCSAAVSFVLIAAGLVAVGAAVANYAAIVAGAAGVPAAIIHDLSYLNAATLGRQALRLAFAGGLALLFVWSGRVIARPFLRESSDRLFGALAAFALGGGAAAYAVAWLALLGLANRDAIGAALAALAVLGAGGGWRRREVAGPLARPTPFRVGFALLLAAALLAHLLLALSPPIEVDELTYHLLGPKRWLQAGGFVEIASVFHTYLPSHVEMHFLTALALCDDVGAKLTQSVVWAMTGLATYGLARRFGAGRRPAGLAALAFVTMPIVVKCGAAAYVDLSLTFYTLLAVDAAFRAAEARQPRLFYLAALLSGMALGTKWFGVNAVALVFGIGLASWIFGEHARARAIAARLLVGGLLAGAPAAPYLIRNAAWTGNPFYPFADALFGSRAWTKGAWLSFYALQGGHWLPAGLRDFFFPWLGVAPLLTLPPALWAASRDRRAAALLAVFGMFCVLLLVQSPQERFFFAAFGALAAAAAAGVERSPSAPVRAFFLAALALTVALNSWLTIVTNRDRLPPVVNEDLREQFLTRKLPPYEMAAWINGRYGPDDVYVLFGPVEFYYYNAPFISGSTQMRRVIDYAQIDSAEDFVRRLRELQATHVVLSAGYKAAAAFDQRLKKQLDLPPDAWTFDGHYYRCVQALLRSPYLRLERTSPDGQTLLARIVDAPP